MPTAPPPSRDVALETRFFWERFKKPILAAAIVVLLAITAFTAYRFYSDRRAAAASAALASANTAQEYEQVIAGYSNTPAAADAYILLAEAQRKEKKFAEANKTLETFIAKYPKHEFVTTAKMATAANLDSMGKTNEALVMYQQIASAYPNSYAAPLAMLSQVYILKSQNRNDDARRICETMLTQYRTSFWAGEAMQQLRLLKPVTTSTPPPAAAVAPMAPPMLAAPAAPAPQAPPAPNQPQIPPPPKKP
jgi:tetratricopeptide (TPR) repeat protein